MLLIPGTICERWNAPSVCLKGAHYKSLLLLLLLLITKFVIYLFGEGAERAEIGEWRGRGRQWGGKEEGRNMGMHEK